MKAEDLKAICHVNTNPKRIDMVIRNVVFKLRSIMREKEEYFIIIKFMRDYLFGPTHIVKLSYWSLPAVN